MTKFLEFIDFKKDKLENILASIIFEYLTDADICQIGDYLVEKKIIKFSSLVEAKDTREIIRRQVKKILKKDTAACLEFLEKYVEDRCVFKGSRFVEIGTKGVEVRIKDEVRYLNSSNWSTNQEVYTYLKGDKYVIEVPSEICNSFNCNTNDGKYFEERKRFFVERCKIKDDNNLVDGLAIVSRNREFIMDLKENNNNRKEEVFELGLSCRKRSRVRDCLEIIGIVVSDERNGFKFIPYNRKFRGKYLFFVEITFKYGFLKIVNKKKALGLR